MCYCSFFISEDYKLNLFVLQRTTFLMIQHCKMTYQFRTCLTRNFMNTASKSHTLCWRNSMSTRRRLAIPLITICKFDFSHKFLNEIKSSDSGYLQGFTRWEPWLRANQRRKSTDSAFCYVSSNIAGPSNTWTTSWMAAACMELQHYRNLCPNRTWSRNFHSWTRSSCRLWPQNTGVRFK